jgi:hypothetical protein
MSCERRDRLQYVEVSDRTLGPIMIEWDINEYAWVKLTVRIERFTDIKDSQ